MKGLPVLVALVFAASFVTLPRNGGGWFWDFGNGLGFLAFAGVLFQMVPRARSGRQHEFLGYAVLACTLAHAFWFLTGDGTVRFYLLPGAPAYMWAGLIALIALSMLTILARLPDRMRIHPRFRTFRRVHRILAFTAVGSALLHVTLSGFYLRSWLQTGLLAALTAVACFAWRGSADPGSRPAVPGVAYLAIGIVAVGGFAIIRNMGQ